MMGAEDYLDWLSHSEYNVHWFCGRLLENDIERVKTYLLNFTKAISHYPERSETIMKSGTTIYRAQIGCEHIIEDVSVRTKLRPHPSSRMFPKAEYVQSGRFNQKNQTVLYASVSEEIAALEIIPVNREPITISELRVLRDLRLVKLTPPPHLSEPYNYVITDLDKAGLLELLLDLLSLACSRAVSVGYYHHIYLATQKIAETCCKLGYDGIVFRSAYWSDCWNDGKSDSSENIVIFNPKHVEIVQSKVAALMYRKPTLSKMP